MKMEKKQTATTALSQSAASCETTKAAPRSGLSLAESRLIDRFFSAKKPARQITTSAAAAGSLVELIKAFETPSASRLAQLFGGPESALRIGDAAQMLQRVAKRTVR
jgi:hypothetical protein